MSITVADIRRAILGAGDVSAFTEVCHEALNNPPVPSIPSLDTTVALPQPMVLLEQIDKELATLMAAWEKANDYQRSSQTKVDLTLVAVAPYGRNIGKYLENVIDEVRPDVIAVDSCPLELSANMLYAFGIPCAVGLPAYGEITVKNSGQIYTSDSFYPGNINETAIIKSWLIGIPLLPVGSPQKPLRSNLGFGHGNVDDTYIDRVTWEPGLLRAYRTLDEGLNGITSLQEGTEIAKDICLGLMRTMSSKMREAVTEEACYIASRIMDIAAYANSRRQRNRILAIVDMVHYSDVSYIADLIAQGITDEIYVLQKSGVRLTDMVLVGKNRHELSEETKEYTPKSTLAQGLFRSQFDRLIESKDAETLSEPEAYRLITKITSRTRVHPDIVRGASVRGTIAFEEILRSLLEIGGVLTRESIAKAAIITLPPRISLRQQGNEVAIVSDIVKEVLYDIRFSSRDEETALSRALDWLSAGDVLGDLGKLGQISPAQNQELTQGKLPAIVADTDKNREMLKVLEAMNLLTQKQQGQYPFTKKGLEYLISELEQKLRAGEITPDDYSRQKARLTEMLRNISEPRFKMSRRELATTIAEIMDAQDKQWNSEVSFDRMHVYYHIKENSEGAELSPQKRDYHALKRFIDDLEKQGILMAAGETSGFILTGTALKMLFEYLINKGPADRGLQGAVDFGRALTDERNHEIRRYSSGDVFRDISIRHTLKEIVKQKKSMSDVRSSDFRVFLKQPRKQSDIVLCLDTSGSMGFQHKLMYARLAAAGLVHAAIENKDRVGMVAFNDHGHVTVPIMEKNTDSLIDRIAGLSARGNTNIGDGIKCSSELLFHDHSHNQKYIILITDGQPTAISERTFTRLKVLKERDLTEESAILETRQATARGVSVSAIHIAGKGEASSGFIRSIAQIGKGKIRRISSPDDLKTILR